MSIWTHTRSLAFTNCIHLAILNIHLCQHNLFGFLLFYYLPFPPSSLLSMTLSEQVCVFELWPIRPEVLAFTFLRPLICQIHINNNKSQNIKHKYKFIDMYVWYLSGVIKQRNTQDRSGELHPSCLLFTSVLTYDVRTQHFSILKKKSGHNANSFTNTMLCHYVSSKILKIYVFYHVIKMPSAICAKHHSLSELSWKPS